MCRDGRLRWRPGVCGRRILAGSVLARRRWDAVDRAQAERQAARWSRVRASIDSEVSTSASGEAVSVSQCSQSGIAPDPAASDNDGVNSTRRRDFGHRTRGESDCSGAETGARPPCGCSAPGIGCRSRRARGVGGAPAGAHGAGALCRRGRRHSREEARLDLNGAARAVGHMGQSAATRNEHPTTSRRGGAWRGSGRPIRRSGAPGWSWVRSATPARASIAERSGATSRRSTLSVRTQPPIPLAPARDAATL